MERKTMINVAVMMVTILLFVGVMEVAFRMTPISYETYWWGEARSNRLVHQDFEFNNFGYRDIRDYPVEKPDNTIRIISMGDSFTMAAGILDYRDSFNKLIEVGLNKNNGDFELINMGRGGYNTPKELEVLKEEVLKLQPDIIILNYFPNDADAFDSNIRTRLPQLVFLTKHSVFYYFAISRLDNILWKFNILPTYEEALVFTYDESNNDLINHAKLLNEFISTVKDNDITLLITIFPVIHDFDNYNLRNAHEYVTGIANEQGVYILDLLPYYINENADDLKVNPYDAHPNEKGHKIAADAIYDKLLEIMEEGDVK